MMRVRWKIGMTPSEARMLGGGWRLEEERKIN
jgi:hypothetical protein